MSKPETGHKFEEEANKTLDHSEWVINIKEKLNQAGQENSTAAWAKMCIYRVPQCLRERDDKSYIPRTVSLGPYHHGRRHLRTMDPHKWRALYRVLKRTQHDIALYLDSIKGLEGEARACYEGTITLTSKEFVEMMVLDGCFILELFRGAIEGFKKLGYSRKDPIFAMRASMHSLQRDMIMLENQIPLFVLDRLLGLENGDPDKRGLVAKLAIQFFDPLMPTDESLQSPRPSLSSLEYATTFDPLADQGGLHCLDVFRRSLMRAGPKAVPKMWIKRWSSRTNQVVADKRRQQLVHCVTELREAGIKFKKRKTDRFWDIKFKDGTLSIPRLLIHDGTKSLLLNLIALEQCHLDCSNDITSYVIFMDNLFNSPADVAYLHYHGIIEHWLGTNGEVVDLFNRLSEEVVFDIDGSYLSQLSEQVNRYYNHRWNAWRANLKHNYFNNPWAILSFVAAVVLLLITFAQTFYAVYSYYRPLT
ncbi:unnamed protein product [Camellia sinensis]|uniref:Uncharacterized protein n=1 Tax=Camellia sinensis TaxID=4442 RepID=A0A7J7I8Q5_CAMSI|nr:hypothetical protein HYC85_002561 [Camellia sinensis]